MQQSADQHFTIGDSKSANVKPSKRRRLERFAPAPARARAQNLIRPLRPTSQMTVGVYVIIAPLSQPNRHQPRAAFHVVLAEDVFHMRMRRVKTLSQFSRNLFLG